MHEGPAGLATAAEAQRLPSHRDADDIHRPMAKARISDWRPLDRGFHAARVEATERQLRACRIVRDEEPELRPQAVGAQAADEVQMRLRRQGLQAKAYHAILGQRAERV